MSIYVYCACLLLPVPVCICQNGCNCLVVTIPRLVLLAGKSASDCCCAVTLPPLAIVSLLPSASSISNSSTASIEYDGESVTAAVGELVSNIPPLPVAAGDAVPLAIGAAVGDATGAIVIISSIPLGATVASPATGALVSSFDNALGASVPPLPTGEPVASPDGAVEGAGVGSSDVPSTAVLIGQNTKHDRNARRSFYYVCNISA
jgi:hypothetical protein